MIGDRDPTLPMIGVPWWARGPIAAVLTALVLSPFALFPPAAVSPAHSPGHLLLTAAQLTLMSGASAAAYLFTSDLGRRRAAPAAILGLSLGFGAINTTYVFFAVLASTNLWWAWGGAHAALGGAAGWRLTRRGPRQRQRMIVDALVGTCLSPVAVFVPQLLAGTVFDTLLPAPLASLTIKALAFWLPLALVEDVLARYLGPATGSVAPTIPLCPT